MALDKWDSRAASVPPVYKLSLFSCRSGDFRNPSSELPKNEEGNSGQLTINNKILPQIVDTENYQKKGNPKSVVYKLSQTAVNQPPLPLCRSRSGTWHIAHPTPSYQCDLYYYHLIEQKRQQLSGPCSSPALYLCASYHRLAARDSARLRPGSARGSAPALVSTYSSPPKFC